MLYFIKNICNYYIIDENTFGILSLSIINQFNFIEYTVEPTDGQM